MTDADRSGAAAGTGMVGAGDADRAPWLPSHANPPEN